MNPSALRRFDPSSDLYDSSTDEDDNSSVGSNEGAIPNGHHNAHSHDNGDENPSWVRAQIKAFTGWMNVYLGRRGIAINDIRDVCTGSPLLNLLEIFEDRSIFSKVNLEVSSSNFRYLENVQLAIEFFTKNSHSARALVGITPHAIVNDKNLDLILGLVWQFILKYAITDRSKAGAPSSDNDDIIGVNSETVTEVLLRWVREHVPSHIAVENFTSSFRDGKVFAHLVNHLKPGSMDMSQIQKLTEENLLRYAFSTAENHLKIPQLLDAYTVNQSPEQQSIMTYTSFFRQFEAVNDVRNQSELDMGDMRGRIEQLKMELTQERQARDASEKQYDLLADELDEERLKVQRYENTLGSSDATATLLAEHAQEKQRLQAEIASLKANFEKVKDSYVLCRKRLKAASDAGRLLREKCERLEQQCSESRLELQLKMEDRMSASEHNQRAAATEAHQARVNAMLAQLDKAKARRQELEQKLRDAEKAYKREVRHREDLAYQVKILHTENTRKDDKFLDKVLGVDDKSTQTDDIWLPKPRRKRRPRQGGDSASEQDDQLSSLGLGLNGTSAKIRRSPSSLSSTSSQSSYRSHGRRGHRHKKRGDHRASSPKDRTSGVSSPPLGTRSLSRNSSIGGRGRDAARGSLSSDIFTPDQWTEELDPVKVWSREQKEVETKFKQKKNKVKWQFILKNEVHNVVLEHGLTSGKRKIAIDGFVEYSEKQPLNRPSEHNFYLKLIPLSVSIEKQGSFFGYNLRIDGKDFEDLRMRALGLVR